MKILHSLADYQKNSGFLAATLGNFDGVHCGHRQLIKSTVEEAARRQGEALVFTFEPHPLAVLKGDQLKLLQQREAKREAIAELGVDYLLELPFTKQLAALSPEEFFKKYLAAGLKPDWLTVGYNFSFGAGGQGDARLLQALGREYNIETKIEPAFIDEEGLPVSSSRIRQLIGEGKISKANGLLGREYMLMGEIVHGRQLGRQFGFPTANILAKPGMLLPAFGVYAAWAECGTGASAMPAVVNVGLRPTVAENIVPTIETHCLGVEQDFYGQLMRVRFVQEIRPERRFDSFELLVRQIAADCETAGAILQ